MILGQTDIEQKLYVAVSANTIWSTEPQHTLQEMDMFLDGCHKTTLS